MGAWKEHEQEDGAGTRDNGASAAVQPVRLNPHEPEGLRLDIQLAIEWAHLGGD